MVRGGGSVWNKVDKKLLNRSLYETREEAMCSSVGGAFRAEKRPSAKVLSQMVFSASKERSEG